LRRIGQHHRQLAPTIAVDGPAPAVVIASAIDWPPPIPARPAAIGLRAPTTARPTTIGWPVRTAAKSLPAPTAAGTSAIGLPGPTTELPWGWPARARADPVIQLPPNQRRKPAGGNRRRKEFVPRSRRAAKESQRSKPISLLSDVNALDFLHIVTFKLTSIW
jgi:hypothetical protein